jgi:hypothetical protein
VLLVCTPENDLDRLLGLNPNMPDAPQRIWEAISARFRGGVGVVRLTFAIESRAFSKAQAHGYVTLQYPSYPPEDRSFEAVKMDCAALVRLGFDNLRSHDSYQ